MPITETVRIEVFEREDCSHCRDEKTFLNQLQKERGDLIVIFHDIGESEHKEQALEARRLVLTAQKRRSLGRQRGTGARKSA